MSNQLTISEMSFRSSPVLSWTPKFAMFHVAINNRFCTRAGIALVCLCCLRWVISFATLYAYWNVGFGKGGTGPPWACVERRFCGCERSIVRPFLRHERVEMRQGDAPAPGTLRCAQGRSCWGRSSPRMVIRRGRRDERRREPRPLRCAQGRHFAPQELGVACTTARNMAGTGLRNTGISTSLPSCADFTTRRARSRSGFRSAGDHRAAPRHKAEKHRPKTDPSQHRSHEGSHFELYLKEGNIWTSR